MAGINVAGLRRNIKNLAHNYSDAQVSFTAQLFLVLLQNVISLWKQYGEDNVLFKLAQRISLSSLMHLGREFQKVNFKKRITN